MDGRIPRKRDYDAESIGEPAEFPSEPRDLSANEPKLLAALRDAVETTDDCVRIMAAMWRELEVDPERFEQALDGDFSLATELADMLVERGVPFREAHGVVGRVVRHCEDNGLRLDELTPDQAEEFHPKLAGDLSVWLDPRAAVERRTSRGGTAWSEVQRQAASLREKLG